MNQIRKSLWKMLTSFLLSQKSWFDSDLNVMFCGKAGREVKQVKTFVFYSTYNITFPLQEKGWEQMKCSNYLSFLVHHLKMMPFSSQWWPLLYSACVGDTELSVSRSAVTMERKERFITLSNSVTCCQVLETEWCYIANRWSNPMRRKWMLLCLQGQDFHIFHLYML